MYGNSEAVRSNQDRPHPSLEPVVLRHLRHPWRAPVADHDRRAFDQAAAWRQRLGETRALIFDSGCGTARSSVLLARRFPDALVLGLDQSEHRLNRAQRRFSPLPENLLLLRTDCTGFWRLAWQAGWRPRAHYLLYPNPWPKSAHLKRRWHGHPVWPTLLALGGELEVRSNWRLYLLETQVALSLSGVSGELGRLPGQTEYLTDFEQKYQDSGQPLWRLNAVLSV